MRCVSERQTAFDCAVLDVHFPDGDIDPVARLMQRAGEGADFHHGARDRAAAKNWPLAEVIAKPFQERGLLRAVSACKKARYELGRAVGRAGGV